MHPYLYTVLVLGVGYVAFTIVKVILESRRNGIEAKKLGCQPPPLRKSKYPLGLEFVTRLVDADRRGQVPNEFEVIHGEMKCNTWDQWLFGSKVTFTSDPRNIQAMLATQFSNFEIGPLRKSNFFPLLGNGIFIENGKAWEHSRSMLRPQFARDQVGDLELEESHLQTLFEHLKVDESGWTQKLDLSPLFFRLTLDSATEFLFGQSVHSQAAALPDPVDGKKTGQIGTLDWTAFGWSFNRAIHTLGDRARLGDLYWMHSPKTFKEDCKVVHEFANYYVNLALNGSNEDPSLEKGTAKPTYVFLAELAKATRDPIELRSQLLNILLAGRDTTAGLLGWIFWLLARHPDVFNKLRGVVLESFGTYDNLADISFETLKGCTYLQQVMKETLRLFPSVPINARCATKDTSIPRGGGPGGESPVFIAKGQEVLYSVHVMQRRKDIYGEDALEFKPERWATLRPGWGYLPFNGGPRLCLGQQFALTEAGFCIVRMLQRFDRLENLDPSTEVRHQYSVTTSPHTVELRLHEAGR